MAGADFLSASALFSRRVGPLDAAVRIDQFRMKNLFPGQLWEVGEEGHAATVSASTVVGQRHQFTIEASHVSADRDVLNGRQTETLVYLDYRVGF